MMLFLQQRGHQMQANRLVAATNGETHFEGSKCKICSSTKRWTMNGSCVFCAKQKSKIAVNKQRLEIKQLMDDAKARK